MTHNLLFLKKELMEGWRSKKIILLLVVFAAFGIMNPLIALLTPELLKSLSTDIAIQLPDPTSIDVWTQYFKNIGQLGLIIFIILFGDCVSKEIDKQTLILPVTKGLKRSTVILSKTIYLFTLWTCSLLISYLISYGYSLYYFPDNNSPHIIAGIFLLWIFGLLLFSIMIFGSTLLHGYMGLLILAVIWLIGMLLTLVSKLDRYNPIKLSSVNVDVVKGTISLSDYVPAIIISCLFITIFIGLSIKLLNRKLL